MDDQSRSTNARVGIAALNILNPGLGLIRLGEGRAALAVIGTGFALAFLSILAFATIPFTSLSRLLILLAITIPLAIALLVVSIVLSWRRSRTIEGDRPWWTRWYGVLLAFVLLSVAANLLVGLAHRFYKPFYLPSEAMAPTLGKNDRILADMHRTGPPAIGDIILFRVGRYTYIKRVAALGGDRIAMRAGVPVVNGRAAVQTPQGMTRFVGFDGVIPARLIKERLPGEAGSHYIAETGPSPFDDMDEVVVPQGHVFVLGDNRERSADSRVPPEEMGVGMLPESDIQGLALFITWSRDRSAIGRSLTE